MSRGANYDLQVDSIFDEENCAYLFDPSSLVKAIEQMISIVNREERSNSRYQMSYSSSLEEQH